MSTYAYGACCCPAPGWYDVYWPGGGMGATPNYFARTSNSADLDGDDNTYADLWACALTEDEYNGTWEKSPGVEQSLYAFRSIAVTNPAYDSERVWVNYLRLDGEDEEELAVLITSDPDPDPVEEQVWYAGDYAYPSSAVRLPFEAGVGMPVPDVATFNQRQNFFVVPNGACGYTGMQQVFRGASSSLVNRYTLEDDGSHTYQSWTIPLATSSSWTELARCHAVSARYWPKCAGVRTVWNNVPDSGSGAYDFDIDIVYGEVNSFVQGMTVTGVLKTWNFTGTSTYNADPNVNKDNAWIDAGRPWRAVTGYIEDHDGNKAVRFRVGNTSGATYTEPLEYNGTEIIADCSSVTITESDGVTTDSGWIHNNMMIFTPRASFPDDNSDRIIMANEYRKSNQRCVQLCDVNGDSLRDFLPTSSEMQWKLGAAGSDAYAYVRRELGGSDVPVYMVRLDNAFAYLRTSEPMAPTASYEAERWKHMDCVRLTDLDDYTPPLAESDLV